MCFWFSKRYVYTISLNETLVFLWLPRFSSWITHFRVGSFDGELVEPLVVVDHAVTGLTGDQLIAQHPPGKTEVQHALHCTGPVVQTQVTWRRWKCWSVIWFQTNSHPLLHCLPIRSTNIQKINSKSIQTIIQYYRTIFDCMLVLENVSSNK